MKELLKCNLFRIALYVDEEGGYAYNPTLRSRTQVLGEDDWGQVENVVRWCGEHGIYCLIDWHVHDPGNPQHWRYRNRKYPEKVEGIDLAADFFTYCARRFQNQKHVLFEICNEPNPIENYQFKEEVTWLDHIKPYCEDMLKIIRSYDEDVVVICGTPSWSSKIEDVIGNEPLDANGEKYKNIMYTFHFYAATHNEERMEAFQKASPQIPLFVTEWGTTKADGRTDFSPELSSRWLEILAGDNDGKQLISWINWSFSAEGGLSAALRWNSGNIATDFPQILSESGKYIYEQLKKAKD
jgi:aryl-phospho-beta-D-glucosidase BglC (GH1 family)